MNQTKQREEARNGNASTWRDSVHLRVTFHSSVEAINKRTKKKKCILHCKDSTLTSTQHHIVCGSSHDRALYYSSSFFTCCLLVAAFFPSCWLLTFPPFLFTRFVWTSLHSSYLLLVLVTSSSTFWLALHESCFFLLWWNWHMLTCMPRAVGQPCM